MSFIFLLLQVSLREGCDKILVADCLGLLDRLVQAQRRGTYLTGKGDCLIYFPIIGWFDFLNFFNIYS